MVQSSWDLNGDNGARALDRSMPRCVVVGRGRTKHHEFAMASGELAPKEFVQTTA